LPQQRKAFDMAKWKRAARERKPSAPSKSIPALPRSQIAQALKFAVQDIEAILVLPDRREFYGDFLGEIESVVDGMRGLQARLTKSLGSFVPQSEELDSLGDDQGDEPESYAHEKTVLAMGK
jgi:hypothetical protein